METLERITLPRYEELPKINLYLDQVIEQITDYLTPILGVGEPKWISSSMIGNYIKQNLLPKPVGKKYTKDHLAHLIFICLAKQVFSSVEMEKIVRIMNSMNSIESYYDYFCTEVETIHYAVFSKNIIPDNDFKELPEDTFLIRTIIIAIINKLFIQNTLDPYLEKLSSVAE